MIRKQKGRGEIKAKNFSREVEEADELMSYLLKNLAGKNRNNIKTILREKQVFVNGRSQTKYNYALKPGMTVEVRWTRIPVGQEIRGLKIVFEDQHLIVIEKEAGLLSIATNKEKRATAYSLLSDYVKMQDSEAKIFVVHRLDRDTSGLMLFAKSEEVKELLQESWNDTILQRTYVAVTEGEVQEDKATISSYLFETTAMIVYSSQNPNKGSLSVTHFEVIKKTKAYSLVSLNLDTGRKHQIRVHMKEIGHPIIGDKKYGARRNPIGRLGLHAMVIAFTHPITKKDYHFETKIPVPFLNLFVQKTGAIGQA